MVMVRDLCILEFNIYHMAKEKANIISEYHLHQHQPQKPQFAIHDLHEYLHQHHGNASRPHIHSFYQIIWFHSGNGKHFVDFQEYEVFDNAIFFIAMNQVHYFDSNSDYKGILIHFNESFLVQDSNEVAYFLKCSLFNNPYQQPSCCIGKGIETVLESYIQQIRRELEEGEEFGREELLKIYLKAFLVQVQRRKNAFEQTEGKTPFIVDEKRMQLVQFVNFIDDNYMKGLSVAEYAQLMYISSRTLSDLTSQLLNKTPSLMIQERIILEAKRLLLHSSLNINQIGYRLGFDDPSYFVKYFKKHTTISPSEFRKAVS